MPIEVRETAQFQKWFVNLRDVKVRARISARIRRLSHGHFGDAKFVASGLYELRIDIGPGYRLYFCKQSRQVVILLAGGDKSTQSRDIEQAIAMAKYFRE